MQQTGLQPCTAGLLDYCRQWGTPATADRLARRDTCMVEERVIGFFWACTSTFDTPIHHDAARERVTPDEASSLALDNARGVTREDRQGDPAEEAPSTARAEPPQGDVDRVDPSPERYARGRH